MNPDYEKQLEARMRRELESLGELSAPPALANRILRTIEQRAALPWYRQSWETWPLLLRVTSLLGLLAAFGALCYGGWELSQGEAGRRVLDGWSADLGALWRTLEVLTNTLSTFISRLGSGVIVAGLVLLFTACVACIGLGTLYVRLALRPEPERI